MTTVTSSLSDAFDNIKTANTTYRDMLTTHSNLIVNVNGITKELNELIVNNTRINSDAVVANDTASEAQESFQERSEYLNMIENEHTQLVTEINAAKDAMNDLQQQLIEAQEAAALVSNDV